MEFKAVMVLDKWRGSSDYFQYQVSSMQKIMLRPVPPSTLGE